MDNDFTADVQKSCSVKIKYSEESENLYIADFYYADDETAFKTIFNDVLTDRCIFFSDVVDGFSFEDKYQNSP